MKFLVISDGHGDTESLRTLENKEKDICGVIYAGDFAAFQKPETGRPFLEALMRLHKNIFAVLGNCDSPQFLKEIEKRGISIAQRIADFNGLVFAGSGGGSKFTGLTPYERTDEELVSDLDAVEKRAGEIGGYIKNLVLVCHNPPYGVKTDMISGGIHVGSKLILDFILKHRPLLVISGHIHEAFAVDEFEGVLLLNPGALFEGRYAVVEFLPIDEDLFKARVELKTL